MSHTRLGSTSSAGITKLASTGPAPSRRQTRRQKGTGASIGGTGTASQLPAIAHRSVSGSRAATVESSAGPAAASGGPRLTKESVCIDILRSGHVNAFVDFFYLSHRADPNPDKARSDGGRSEIHLSQSDLSFLQRALCEAETCRRRGDVRAVLDAYAGLSEHYAAGKDSNTAVYFYEKCLEVAQSVGDVSAELHTLHSLGTVYKGNNDLESSIAYFEAHRDTAQRHADAALESGGGSGDAHLAATPFKAEVQRASSALVGVYGAAAEAAAAAGDDAGCLAARQQALEAALHTGDAAAEAATNFHVGRTHVGAGQPAEGVAPLMRFLDLSSDTAVALAAEALGATRAAGYAGLAAAYHALGSTDKATSCLHDFLTVAEEAGDVAAQAHACSSLGDIHNRHGDFSRAVKSFEKSYKLYRSLVLAKGATHPDDAPPAPAVGGCAGGVKHSLHRDVDKAKVHLGMARGNATMGTYVNVIVTDVGALLKWKNKRTYMKAGDIAAGAADA